MKNSKYKELQESNRKRLMRVIKQKETTGQEGVDRSSSTSETVIPPLPPLPHHLAEGWGGGGGGGGRCYGAKCLGVSAPPEDIKQHSGIVGRRRPSASDTKWTPRSQNATTHLEGKKVGHPPFPSFT